MTYFRWGASTHAGRVRPANQDSMFADAGLFVVADGMGGHRAGETASRLTVESLAATDVADIDSLEEAIREANRVVHRSSSDDSELQGMGTTVTVLRLAGSPTQALLANVGDSRAYRLRGDTFERLTDDHSYVGALLREGSINEQEAEHHPYRNMLTRAIGIEPDVDVDSWTLDVEDGDRYLLCSDGLINELADAQVLATLRRLADPGEAARELVRLANDRGGRDNITVVVVDALADDDEGAVATTVDVTEEAPLFDLEDAEVDDVTEADDDLPATQELPVESEADATSTEATEAFAALAAERAGTAVADPEPEAPAESDAPLLTWRLLGFVFLVVAAVFGAIAAVGFWARGGAHVDFAGNEVVIFEGRSGSVLWFEPTLVERSGLFRDELPEAVVEGIEGGREVDSVADARAFVEEIRAEFPPTSEAAPVPTTAAPANTTPTTATPTTTPPTTAALTTTTASPSG
ncbi:MAG: Stp1/IreP family PP2C-type Ser/Thr phosphatase [Actinomycetota bacterium]